MLFLQVSGISFILMCQYIQVWCILAFFRALEAFCFNSLSCYIQIDSRKYWILNHLSFLIIIICSHCYTSHCYFDLLSCYALHPSYCYPSISSKYIIYLLPHCHTFRPFDLLFCYIIHFILPIVIPLYQVSKSSIHFPIVTLPDPLT